jgi:hypothetical protein
MTITESDCESYSHLGIEWCSLAIGKRSLSHNSRLVGWNFSQGLIQSLTGADQSQAGKSLGKVAVGFP